MTKSQADAVLNELLQIRQLLERQASPRPAQPQQCAAANVVQTTTARVHANADWRALGRKDAPVTIVEFVDLECPYCRRFHQEIFPKFKRDYIDSGKVRLVTCDFPLPMHPNAKRAAAAVRCAGDQGKYWEMREALLAAEGPLDDDQIWKVSSDLQLSTSDLNACVNSGKYRSDIDSDQQIALKAEIRGTPAFVIAPTSQQPLEGFRVIGAQSYSELALRVEQLLTQGGRHHAVLPEEGN